MRRGRPGREGAQRPGLAPALTRPPLPGSPLCGLSLGAAVASGAVVIISGEPRCGLQPRFWGGRHLLGDGGGLTVHCAGRSGPGATVLTRGLLTAADPPRGAPLAACNSLCGSFLEGFPCSRGASELGVLQPVCGLL